jgi:hypothetical protein
MGHFKKDCPEINGNFALGHFKKDCPKINGNSAQIVSEGYEDVGALVVCCLEDEEGDVSHLGSDAL